MLRNPRFWFAGICAVHLIASALLLVPGYLLIDEVIYHWAALEVPVNGGLEVETGYREYPSPEYGHKYLPVYKGRTVPQYPYLYPLLAAPFVHQLGVLGLILPNLVAFPLLVWVTWMTARVLFARETAAWIACVLLAFGGFTWEYSIGAWPHMVSMTLGAAVLLLTAKALAAPTPPVPLRLAFFAGLLAGLNLGIRIDTVTLPAALVLLLLYMRPCRWREAAALAVGTIPGVALLAATNLIKFGTISPVSYGTESGTRLVGLAPVVAAAVAAATAAGWLLTRERTRSWTRRHRRALLSAAAGLTATVLVLPATSRPLRELSVNVWTKFVDMSALPRAATGDALRRTPDGGAVYVESLKKGWLQGMPWLAVLIVPAAALASSRLRRRLGGEKDAAGVSGDGRRPLRRSLALLFAPGLLLAGLTSLLAFHGGLALNQRYLLPLLPCASLLGGWTLDTLFAKGPQRQLPAVAAAAAAITGVVTAAFVILVHRVVPLADQQGFLLLRWPLLLAVAVALAALGVLVAGARVARGAVRMLGLLLSVALGWSFAVSFFYDLPRHRLQRLSNLEVARAVRPLIPPGSAFFSEPYLDPFYALIEVPRVRLLFPLRDEFRDFAALVSFHQRAGRPVFGVFRASQWQRLADRALAGRSLTPVLTFEERFEHGPVLRVRGPGLVKPVDPQQTFILARIELEPPPGGTGRRLPW